MRDLVWSSCFLHIDVQLWKWLIFKSNLLFMNFHKQFNNQHLDWKRGQYQHCTVLVSHPVISCSPPKVITSLIFHTRVNLVCFDLHKFNHTVYILVWSFVATLCGIHLVCCMWQFLWLHKYSTKWTWQFINSIYGYLGFQFKAI